MDENKVKNKSKKGKTFTIALVMDAVGNCWSFRSCVRTFVPEKQ